MNISPAANATASLPSGSSAQNTKHLQQQKQAIQKQIQALQSGDNAQSKDKQIEALQQKLEQINAQIQAQKPSSNKRAPTAKSSAPQRHPDTLSISPQGRAHALTTTKFSAIVNNSNAVKQAEITQSVQKKVDHQVRILKSQATSDQGVTKEHKLEEIGDLQQVSANISTQIGDKLNKVNEDTSIDPDNDKVPADK